VAVAPNAAPGGAVSPRIVNGGGRLEQVAGLGGSATDAGAPAADPTGPSTTPAVAKPTANAKFRWPVKGSVLAGFGKRPDGTHNDGVDIAVPAGTEVQAADGGTVAYAGNELKGFGNLVLIRHDNGWVSAYAHADELLVKRGDAVRRGQVIAKSGKTGTVDQPKLHFELRQGSKPVDPMPHLEKL
jgi:murein DD-endopeptidase MepM/ murein hydrolase activator NlpD